jgi:RNA polymerase sigma factor (sigma-70 family)
VQFERLYADCHAAILGYVLRRAENPDDAADAIAETFLIAWRRSEEIPGGEERRLWLYGVARRVLANQRRGERRRFALTQRLSTELAHVPRPSEPTNALAGLTDAFKQLPESDREILALEGWEGLEPAQIATVLGCSRNAARIRLHRARRRLAEELAHQNAESKRPGARTLSGEAT